jgi:hypothetical protein
VLGLALASGHGIVAGALGRTKGIAETWGNSCLIDMQKREFGP